MWPQPIGPIIISLDLDIGAVAKLPLPTAEYISARYIFGSIQVKGRGRGVICDILPLPDSALIKITLNRQRIPVVIVPVHPETTLAQLPIIEIIVIRMEFGSPPKAIPYTR